MNAPDDTPMTDEQVAWVRAQRRPPSATNDLLRQILAAQLEANGLLLELVRQPGPIRSTFPVRDIVIDVTP